MEETRIISRHASTSLLERAPPLSRTQSKKKLCKQLSMLETPRDAAWERQRRRMSQQDEKRKSEDLTDEDMKELKGCIELGFGFKEEDGQELCNTLPALDLYFAVNRRQFYSSPTSPLSSPTNSTPGIGDRTTSLGNIGTESGTSDSWKICSPGDDPQQVKEKLRHWAQAVACSVLQSH